MTSMQYTDIGYLKDPYLEEEYLGGKTLGAMGFQFRIEIKDEPHALGFQSFVEIKDKLRALGFQYLGEIKDSKKVNGYQFLAEIKDNPDIRAMQFLAEIKDTLKVNGYQAEIQIKDKAHALGFQAFSEIKDYKAPKGFQFEASISETKVTKGFQSRVEISNTPSVFGFQFLSEIINSLKANGLQSEAIINTLVAHGWQFHVIIDSSKTKGLQFLSEITKYKSNAFQIEVIIDKAKAIGFEFRKDHYQSYPITGYLEDAYLSDPYLTGYFGPRFPMQFYADVTHESERGFQSLVNVIDTKKIKGTQSYVNIIDKLKVEGFQFLAGITKEKTLGFQFRGEIVDKLKIEGFQFLANIQKSKAHGFQFLVTTQHILGMQFLSTIYNTKNLRILSNFKSRGLTNTNWTSNSTMPGDFSANNFDSDIVEKVWRSDTGTKTGVRLTCDIGASQICYVDTIAILNHNLTVGATIQFLQSNDPTFTTGVSTITIRARRYDTYYIAPELPIAGYRYFRVQIDDPTNPNTYLEIGNIMFGAADIIHGENFTDEVDFEMTDYSDQIETEGHTRVSNSRALKRKLTLNFESLNYNKRNYDILRNVFQTYRTTHKCLWIPTPSILNQDLTDRLRIFGKLVTVPKERHNNKGSDADYISFTVDLDEAL